jgi:MbtH protein
VSAHVTAEWNSRRGSYLVAYLGCRPDTDEHALRRHMASAVADHLRPDVYVVRPTLPVTGHGKIDRRRLLDDTSGLSTAKSEDDACRVVVVNDEGQHAMWPSELPVPAGWRATDRFGTLGECRDYVARVWRDIRPLSACRTH